MVVSSQSTLLARKAHSAGLTPDEYESQVQSLLYRRGFVLTGPRHGGTSALDTATWEEHQYGGYTLRVHPDAHHSHRQSQYAFISLIGHAYDAINGAYTDDAVLDNIAETHAANRLDALFDTLSGRYRVIVIDARGARVWHDPMGSASVFYAESGGACASHVELLARELHTPIADWFVPFITSPNFQNRDVKYLPGAWSPYPGILQLTPNLVLEVDTGDVSRFWPRAPIREFTPRDAVDALEAHLFGTRTWLSAANAKALIGLTGGTDSRGILAACHDLDPTLFTFIYSAKGDALQSPDSKAAKTLASSFDLELNALPVRTRRALNDVATPEADAYRRSTGYYRGNSDLWANEAARIAGPNHIFIRGFGGEILRGFYHGAKNAVTHLSANQLANAYDVNAGSIYTRAAFAHFIESSHAAQAVQMGVDPNDLLYWEHRMGTWGSVALLQNELAFPATVAYSSRHLYTHFLGLDMPTRSSRRHIHEAFERVAPGIMRTPVG